MAEGKVDSENLSRDELTEVPAEAVGSGHSLDAKSPQEETLARIKCVDFFTEWKKCISAYRQFHHYYIYGEYRLCKEEKQRMYNCFKWRGTGKLKFKEAIINSLEEEQNNMYTPNPIWKMRDSPPSDWTSTHTEPVATHSESASSTHTGPVVSTYSEPP